jgi:hypothetical protein
MIVTVCIYMVDDNSSLRLPARQQLSLADAVVGESASDEKWSSVVFCGKEVNIQNVSLCKSVVAGGGELSSSSLCNSSPLNKSNSLNPVETSPSKGARDA